MRRAPLLAGAALVAALAGCGGAAAHPAASSSPVLWWTCTAHDGRVTVSTVSHNARPVSVTGFRVTYSDGWSTAKAEANGLFDGAVIAPGQRYTTGYQASTYAGISATGCQVTGWSG